MAKPKVIYMIGAHMLWFTVGCLVRAKCSLVSNYSPSHMTQGEAGTVREGGWLIIC